MWHKIMYKNLCTFINFASTLKKFYVQFSSVQFSCSVVSNSATPWTATHQALLSITNSQSLLRLISSESVMPSNHLILCRPFSSRLQSFPTSRSFPVSRSFASGGQNIGVSASASFFPMNIQDWFPLRLTGWISLLPKGLSRGFSNTKVQASILQRSELFIAQLSHPFMTTENVIVGLDGPLLVK